MHLILSMNLYIPIKSYPCGRTILHFWAENFEFPYNSVSLIEAEGHLCLFCIICGARQNKEAGTEQVLKLRMKFKSQPETFW